MARLTIPSSNASAGRGGFRLRGERGTLRSISAETKEHTTENGTSAAISELPIRLILWGGVLSATLAASLAAGFYYCVPDSARVAFFAATAVAYIVLTIHCFMRLVYTRWSSWFLYTLGFGGLSFAAIVGGILSAEIIEEATQRQSLTILHSAMLPISCAVLMSAAHALGTQAKGASIKKTYARAILVLLVALVALKSGGLALLKRLVSETIIDPQLAIAVAAIPALIGLFLLNCRLIRTTHDEIVPPVCYWSISMLLAAAVSLASWRSPEIHWWQTAGLELAGVAALLAGLTLENEIAHRSAGDQMDDLNAMQQISWTLVGASDLPSLASALAEAIHDGFRAGRVVVYLATENPSELVIMAEKGGVKEDYLGTGTSCSLRPERRPGFHNGHTSRAFAEGTIQLVHEVYSDVEFLSWRDVAQSEGLVVSVPIPYQETVIGVVNLFLPDVTDLSDRRSGLLESVAAAVSPAIENARLRTERDGGDPRLRIA